MAINVSVVKHGTESSMSLVRRFSKRVLGAGIVRKVKSSRYRIRQESRGKRRTSALRRVEKHLKTEEKERMGLIEPKDPKRGGPHRG
jgi:hypothetical protein